MFPTLVGGGQPGLGPCSRLTPAVLGAIQPPEAFAESKNGLGATWAGAGLPGARPSTLASDTPAGRPPLGLKQPYLSSSSKTRLQ